MRAGPVSVRRTRTPPALRAHPRHNPQRTPTLCLARQLAQMRRSREREEGWEGKGERRGRWRGEPGRTAHVPGALFMHKDNAHTVVMEVMGKRARFFKKTTSHTHTGHAINVFKPTHASGVQNIAGGVNDDSETRAFVESECKLCPAPLHQAKYSGWRSYQLKTMLPIHPFISQRYITLTLRTGQQDSMTSSCVICTIRQQTER